jgi:hypothetical protein
MAQKPTIAASGGQPIWKRRKDEPELAYDIFAAYRDWGAERFYERIFRVFGEEDRPQIDHWRVVYDWDRRLAAFDKFQAADRQIELEESAARMDTRHRKIARLGATVAANELIWYARRQERDPEREKPLASFSQIAKLLKDSVLLSRLIAGEATERTEATITGEDFSSWDQDELDQFWRLWKKNQSA